MKKIFTLLLCSALFAGSCWGKVLLTESFNRNTGTLNSGPNTNMGTDKTNWWNTTSTATYIQVIDTNLTYSKYCSEAEGKAAQFAGNTNKDIRMLSADVTTNSVYYSLLINVKTPKQNTTKDYLCGLMNNGSYSPATNVYGQLKIVSTSDYSKFKLGISKSNDVLYRMSSQELQTNTTYLIIVQYKYVSGEQNDSVFLWINPSKADDKHPTLICIQDTVNNNKEHKGANQMNDATKLNGFYLHPSKNTPSNMILDEIKVATTWEELFEKDTPTPTLTATCTNKEFGTFSAEYEPQQTTITVTGSDLKADVTITPAAGVDVSPNSLTKEAVMASGGAVVTVTSNANFSSMGNTITFSSTDATSKSITITGTPASFASRNSIQDMNNNTAIGGYASLNVISTKIESVNPSNSTFVIGTTYSATIDYSSVPNSYAVNGTISGLKIKKTAENTYKALAFNYTAPSGSIITIHEGQDNTTTLSEHAGDQNISLDRAAFLPNMFNTICLPFDVSEAQKAIRFGSSQVIQLKSSKYSNNEITLTFEPVSQLVAGEPYLINPGNNSISFSFSSGYELVNTTGSTIETDYVDFVGIINPTALPQSKEILFMGQNNELFWPTEAGTLKGLRCYFQVKNTAVSGAPVRMVINKDNTVTNIVDVNANANVNRKVMLNGQLIIIRDGVKFNATGQMIK